MRGGSLQPGAVFAGRYEVVRCIGAGGMGAVYEVIHRETQRRRALKVLLPALAGDQDARERFAREAVVTADIVSEHLVETFDAGVDDATGCPFLAMELLRGESLGERLEKRGKLPREEVVELVWQAARTLEKTHARGIVHRDLKPDNLFVVVREDGARRLKILDFGIAKVVGASGLSRNTVNIGTPLYMAPEQLDGSRLDPRTDLFALGHIAFELLTGESYWEREVRSADNAIAFLRIVDRGLPEAPSVRAARLGVSVGPAFDAWFTRATAVNRDARFARASDLAAAFAAAVLDPAAADAAAARGSLVSLPGGVASLPNPTAPYGVAARTANPTQAPIPKWAWIAGAAAAALAGAGVAYALWPSPPPSTRGTAAATATAAGSAAPVVSPAASAPPSSAPSASAAPSAPSASAAASARTPQPVPLRPTAPVGTSPRRDCRTDPTRCR